MSEKIVYDFVCAFLPEHKKFWDSLTEKESIFFNWFIYKREILEAVIFRPEENPEIVERFRNKIDELKMIITYPECAYDNLLFNEIKSNHYKTKDSFNDYYSFIFESPEKYSVQIKETKLISSYLKKLYALLPSCYSEKSEEYSWLFGQFVVHFDSVTFESDFETIEFKRNEMKLIPYFIEYRNKNLIDWIFKIESQNIYKSTLEKMRSALTRTFINDTAQCNSEQMNIIFQEEISAKISEILFNYGIQYKGGWSKPEIVFQDNSFLIMFDEPNSSFSMEYTYKLSTDDIFTNLKIFEGFIKEITGK